MNWPFDKLKANGFKLLRAGSIESGVRISASRSNKFLYNVIPSSMAARSSSVKEALIKLIRFMPSTMLRRAFDKLHHKGAIDPERNQQLTTHPSISIAPLVVELIEGFIQGFLKFMASIFHEARKCP
jgi:hypothetical protein